MGVEPRSAHAADLFDTTAAWTAGWFDPEVGAVWNPPGSFGEPARARSFHLTPNTAWFAYAALVSGRPEWREHAVAALRLLVDLQYDAPGEPWDGSFPRFVEAPRPGPGAKMWEDFDPNWRQFVGLTFAVAVEDLAHELGPSMVAELEDAIRRCVEGEPDGRIAAGYTNPALMRSWLDAWYGARVHEPALVERGERFASQVVARFDLHGAFDEFNSPTYYGIDLLALRVWQEFAPTAWFAEQGARLEAEVWSSAAAFFNPSLGTFAGPFTRAYTPDARRAVTLMALWVWADAGRAVAPLPDLDAASVDHGHDLMAGPLIARLWRPDTGRADRRRFVVPEGRHRRVEAQLAGDRRVVTEIQPTCSIGLESSPNDWGGWSQFMPLVIQWRDGGGDEDAVHVCWLARPGVVVGELLADPAEGGATIELDLAVGEPVDLLTYAEVRVGVEGEARLGRRGLLQVSTDGSPVVVRAESEDRSPRRLIVSTLTDDTQPSGPPAEPAAGPRCRLRLRFTVEADSG